MLLKEISNKIKTLVNDLISLEEYLGDNKNNVDENFQTIVKQMELKIDENLRDLENVLVTEHQSLVYLLSDLKNRFERLKKKIEQIIKESTKEFGG